MRKQQQEHRRLRQQFELIRTAGENILWMGTPNKVIFILRGVPFLIIGLIWGAIDYFGFIRHMDSKMMGFAIPFFALHLFPTWGSILNLIRLFLVHRNTAYAMTDKRLFLSTGFFGTDFRVIDYDQVGDIMVNVGPIENIFGVGSIRFTNGMTGSKGNVLYDRFVGIENPYAVFKRIKQVSTDVKTDWNYPNALRPETNPGYNTTYEERNKPEGF